MSSPRKKLLEQVRAVLRRKNYAYAIEKAYLEWVRRFPLKPIYFLAPEE